MMICQTHYMAFYSKISQLTLTSIRKGEYVVEKIVFSYLYTLFDRMDSNTHLEKFEAIRGNVPSAINFRMLVFNINPK